MRTSVAVPGERIPRAWVKLTSAAATDTSDGSKDDPMGRQRDTRKSRPSLTLNVPALQRASPRSHPPEHFDPEQPTGRDMILTTTRQGLRADRSVLRMPKIVNVFTKSSDQRCLETEVWRLQLRRPEQPGRGRYTCAGRRVCASRGVSLHPDSTTGREGVCHRLRPVPSGPRRCPIPRAAVIRHEFPRRCWETASALTRLKIWAGKISRHALASGFSG